MLVSLEGTNKNETYRISGDVTTYGSILSIAGSYIACNVQDSVGTAGTEDCADQVKGVTICVVGT